VLVPPTGIVSGLNILASVGGVVAVTTRSSLAVALSGASVVSTTPVVLV